MKVGIVALATMALLAGCSSPFGPPTAQEILAKPGQSDFKAGTFTVTGHYASNGITAQITGTGTLVAKPHSAISMVVVASVGALSIPIQLLSIDGVDYQKTGGDTKWTRTTSTNKPAGADDWSKASSASLVGEENLKQGKAWHVKATSSGKPLELWVRESDGYPLEVMSGDDSGTFTITFGTFNGGITLSAPAPSEIKPEPKTISAAVGETGHMTGADVSVVSVNLNLKSTSSYFGPKAGNRWVAIEVLYVNTGADPIDYNPYDWKMTDSQGFSYDSTFFGKSPQLHSGTIASGERARGFITYEVPKAATGLTAKVTLGADSLTVAIG